MGKKKSFLFQILNLEGFVVTSLCVCMYVCLMEVTGHRDQRPELVFCFHLSVGLSDGTQVAMACLQANTSTQKYSHRVCHYITKEGCSNSIGQLNPANLENKAFNVKDSAKVLVSWNE